ncbi:4-(cytidine 5'-diphospho)-2-C-methyl-D-erythritol kinase [Pseudoruegeria sp. HB172150]|uniref:4-(cytidine 5'-diphospho)-2-C-methyl-D-erythritol kinase n=1 Tax=Pseudoruegeria sp. HB172150 TaxID=2721164 RepID=UPI0015533294|nr:4-(cytidine 5'-diphospho)-2-C-methyl-D-erythritol kinase [Pseudoruegeria sp. HB172150]
MVEVFAPAKINLTLHVTGQRADGYHLLDSLVVFADIGDTIRAEPAGGLSLSIDGPQAAGLSAGADNLVLRAARLLDPEGTAALTLTKRLPVASGIGGGSTDAAATLRALSQLWDRALPDTGTTAALGADIPVCLAAHPVRMRGTGELLTPCPALPALDVLLVNPRVEVSTPAVFRGLASKTNPPMPENLPHWPDAAAFTGWLRGMRNDLLPSARAVCPEIDEALSLIADTGSAFAGMSGSGATCFGLYPPDGRSAASAAAKMTKRRPGWWIAAGSLLTDKS